MAVESAETRNALDESALLGMRKRDLDAIFGAAPPGGVPLGVLDGTALLVPGRTLGRLLSKVVRALFWRGKVVEPTGHALRNRIGPLGLRAIAAAVYPGESRVDGQPCTVLDYSVTSVVAGGVRDEIRLIAPGLYLGVVWLYGRRVAWFTLRTRRP